MDVVDTTQINTFGKSPQADFETIEIPVSEFQNIIKDLAATYNTVAEMVRDAGILRGHPLAKMTARANDSLKAAGSPTEKILLLNAHLRQLLAKIRDALKSRPAEGGKVIQVLSKIQARAIQIVEYVKNLTQDNPERRTEIALDSQQARMLFSGAGEPVSRKETIRAMRRAEALWPALRCGHRPNDGRQTTRLTAKVEELHDAPISGYRDLWQRSDRRVALSP
jgi:hypothetical protein